MPLDQSRLLHPRIAVVGGGITGLSAAWALSGFARVSLFESEPRLGGHARTVLAGVNGDVPVDTGFIVFNYANYPNLTRLFRDLDVPVEKSCMSFGVSVDDGRLEYALTSLDTLFAQRRNMVDPRFLGMLRDILRFNARGEAAAATGDMTIDDLIRALGLGRRFRDHYLLPMCGAIWSTPAMDVGSFPARTMTRFFSNHALMSASGQHQWWTVSGGSIEYIRRLSRALADRGVRLHTGQAVRAVERAAGRITVRVQDQPAATFDHVVFATHADVTLRLLAGCSRPERRALSGISFQDNCAFLHRDARQMPVRRKCWSSWVYQSRLSADASGVGVSYWMNRLQNIDQSDPLFITLNPGRAIPDELIYDETTFRHPVFDRRALQAQRQIAELQGLRNTWHAGAWLRHGFHEDGIASAMRVARAIRRVGIAGSRVAA